METHNGRLDPNDNIQDFKDPGKISTVAEIEVDFPQTKIMFSPNV